MPIGPETQFRSAFAKIAAILAEANLTLDQIIEMTTYHIGLRDHFDLFDAVRREGALVDIPVIASTKA